MEITVYFEARIVSRLCYCRRKWLVMQIHRNARKIKPFKSRYNTKQDYEKNKMSEQAIRTQYESSARIMAIKFFHFFKHAINSQISKSRSVKTQQFINFTT